MSPHDSVPTVSAPTIIAKIVEQHAEEAAFLWSLRDMAADQPHYALRQLADLEERIEAHVDGLRVAGPAGFSIASARLDEYRGEGELFTVAVLALERDGADLERILEFAGSVPESARGLFGAIGWVSPGALRGQAIGWFDAPSPFWRLVGVVACSLHRVDPSSRLPQLLADEPLVRARALRLAGELRRADLREQVQRALNDGDEVCRFWAAWSAGLLGDRAEAIPVLQDYGATGGEFKWVAVDLVLRLMDREAAISWLRGLGRDPSHARLLVVAVGVLGDPVVLPWLMQQMTVDALARVAGESFSMITGVNLSQQGLDGQAPEAFAAGPTDEPSDENVALDPDQNLSWPDRGKVHEWWEKEKHRFAPGVRHLGGIPITESSCNDVLRDGYQRQRRAAAYELAVINPSRPLWNWRARSDTQTKSLRASS